MEIALSMLVFEPFLPLPVWTSVLLDINIVWMYQYNNWFVCLKDEGFIISPLSVEEGGAHNTVCTYVMLYVVARQAKFRNL